MVYLAKMNAVERRVKDEMIGRTRSWDHNPMESSTSMMTSRLYALMNSRRAMDIWQGEEHLARHHDMYMFHTDQVSQHKKTKTKAYYLQSVYRSSILEGPTVPAVRSDSRSTSFSTALFIMDCVLVGAWDLMILKRPPLPSQDVLVVYSVK